RAGDSRPLGPHAPEGYSDALCGSVRIPLHERLHALRAALVPVNSLVVWLRGCVGAGGRGETACAWRDVVGERTGVRAGAHSRALTDVSRAALGERHIRGGVPGDVLWMEDRGVLACASSDARR